MENIKILVVDDEERIRRLVGDFLKREGYQILEAENGKKALEILEEEKNIDLFILDVMMPELDGWTVCREIRKNYQTPIIMLTARGEENDELFGFQLGADEYISKPFSPTILVARIQALLKRTKQNKIDIKNYNDLIIDNAGHIVLIDNNPVDLTPKEFQLLTYLAENEGIALSREKILNAVWDYDYFGDLRNVDTHIKKIRLKIGEKGDLIQTVRGFGYKFEVRK